MSGINHPNADDWRNRCERAEQALAEQQAEIVRLREALEWYGEQARLCRLFHSEGDAGRHALSADGGQRARQALGGTDAE